MLLAPGLTLSPSYPNSCELDMHIDMKQELYDKVYNVSIIIMQSQYKTSRQSQQKKQTRFTTNSQSKQSAYQPQHKNQEKQLKMVNGFDNEDLHLVTSNREAMPIKIYSKQPSIIDEYVHDDQDVPILLDLSIDSDDTDKYDGSQFTNSRQRKPNDIKSIYIEQDEDAGTKMQNHNNISVQDTQAPDHLTLDQIYQMQPKHKTYPQVSHRYGNKMTVIALQAYYQIIEASQQSMSRQQSNKKTTKEVLANLLSSQTKMEKYIQTLTEEAIVLKQKEYRSTEMINYLEEMNKRRKQIEITKLLSCLLAKIAENSGKGKSPEVTLSKNGQIQINFSNLGHQKSERALKGLSKFKSSKDESSNQTSTSGYDKKIKELTNKLDEQDKLIEQTTSLYEEVISNYAITIQNIIKSKQKPENRENIQKKISGHSEITQKKFNKDFQLERLIQNSNSIDPQSLFSRLSHESKQKSRQKIKGTFDQFS